MNVDKSVKRFCHLAWVALVGLVWAGQVLAVPATETEIAKTVLVSQPIRLANGKSFALQVAQGYRIGVAAQGLKRVRFMAKSPDGRVFATDMYDLSDNRRGKVYILDGWDGKKFNSVTLYLDKLRNPNNLTFHTDNKGISWLYLALTDRLVRYRFTLGETKPTNAPQTLATFPDYGLSYKYGGWHLTRTVTIGPDQRVYVSVGSSCNACEEKEAVRATILVMELDGKNQQVFARGLRNAVGLTWVNQSLYATNMGADHLGKDEPNDTLYRIEANRHYGWPYCYVARGQVYSDPKYNLKNFDCEQVPKVYGALPAHSAPLGLLYREQGDFLVALHGSGKRSLGRGYQIVQVKAGQAPQPFIEGFLQGKNLNGRPCGFLDMGKNQFLFSDDYGGVIYYVYPV